jgi:hypothetical protein
VSGTFGLTGSTDTIVVIRRKRSAELTADSAAREVDRMDVHVVPRWVLVVVNPPFEAVQLVSRSTKMPPVASSWMCAAPRPAAGSVGAPMFSTVIV